MELLAEELSPGNNALADQSFMVGIMSLMPALIGLPIEEIIAPLGMADIVCDALRIGSGPLGALLHLAESSETGDLSTLATSLKALPSVNLKAVNRAQTQALQWANSIGQESSC
jgi:EAL and modified HD-GYP domain-containing signal transduction protein